MDERGQGAEEQQQAPTGDADVSFRIFLNYRRKDAETAVGRLWDTLTRGLNDQPGFTEAQIFKDIDTIEPGVDFREAIRDAVAASDVFLAVIGTEWLSAVDARGQRRLDDPADFVRFEIQAALQRAAERNDVRVVPTLVQGAKMPAVEELPEPLSALVDRNAVELTDERWPYDAGRLLVRLKQLEQEKAKRIASDQEAAALAERERMAVEQAEREQAEREQAERDRAARALESRQAQAREAADISAREPRTREADQLRQGDVPSQRAKISRRTLLSLGAGILAVAAGVTAILAVRDGESLETRPDQRSTTWTSSDVPAGVALLLDVAALPGGEAVAVGGGEGRPRVVVSDGGSGWSEETVAGGNGTMYTVAASRTATVAGGTVHDDADKDGEIWKRGAHSWTPVCTRSCADPRSGASGRQEVDALTTTKSGSFVAVGMDTEDAAVWFSQDGSAWNRRAGDDRDLRGAQGNVKIMNGVATVGTRRLVAVGRSGRKGATWSSEDDGRTWTTAKSVPASVEGGQVVLTAVAASSSSRVVAVGYTTQRGGSNSAVAWLSTDGGSTWEQAGVANASARGQKMDDVVWSGSYWTALGQDRSEETGKVIAAVWRSSDGEQWKEVQSKSFSADRDRSIAAAALAGERMIAVGAGIWTSERSE